MVKTLLKCTAALVAAVGVFGYWFVNQPQMDPLMTPERKARIEASPHYVNGQFVPETPHTPVTPSWSFWKEFLFPTPGKKDHTPRAHGHPEDGFEGTGP